MKRLILLLFLFVTVVLPAEASVSMQQYQLPPMERGAIVAAIEQDMDSILAIPFAGKPVITFMVQKHVATTQTLDFYLVMALVLFLGGIRVVDPKYFSELWATFRNPTLGNRQAKDKMRQASFTNFLTNLFFTLSAGFYLYYAAGRFVPRTRLDESPGGLLLMMTLGMNVIYLIKFFAIRFSGWAFRVQGITEQYLFNVFLINKVIGLVLLPFVIVLAFASPAISETALFVSFLLLMFLFANRYLRSWQVFGSFFQYSKFHFFTYLCASELLPLAVLLKFLVRGLLH